MGVPTGGGTLFPTDSANPRGLFELEEVVAFNEEWLGLLGGSWWAPPRVAEQTWRSIDQQKLEEDRLILPQFSPDNRAWFVKDPRLSLLLPLWDRLCMRKHPLIVVLRSPREVARSLNVRNGMTLRRGMALWWAYNDALMRHGRDRSTLLLDFDAAMASPKITVTAVRDFLAVAKLVDSELPLTSVGDLVEANLRRQSDREIFGSAESLAKGLDGMYEHLQAHHLGSVPADFPSVMPDWVEEALAELGEFWSLQVDRDIHKHQAQVLQERCETHETLRKTHEALLQSYGTLQQNCQETHEALQERTKTYEALLGSRSYRLGRGMSAPLRRISRARNRG